MKNTLAFILIALLTVVCSAVYAQDRIFFRNGTQDSGKVIEIGPQVISYKKQTKPQGPIYRVLKADVLQIEYAGGHIDIMPAPVLTQAVDTFVPTERNIISINALGLAIGNMHVQYERFKPGGRVGIRTHLIMSTVPRLANGALLSAGIDCNLYPEGNKKFTYFIGPGLRVGFNDNSFSEFDINDNFFTLLINCGITYRPRGKLFMGVQGALGPRIASAGDFVTNGYLAFNFGTRF